MRDLKEKPHPMRMRSFINKIYVHITSLVVDFFPKKLPSFANKGTVEHAGNNK